MTSDSPAIEENTADATLSVNTVTSREHHRNIRVSGCLIITVYETDHSSISDPERISFTYVSDVGGNHLPEGAVRGRSSS